MKFYLSLILCLLLFPIIGGMGLHVFDLAVGLLPSSPLKPWIAGIGSAVIVGMPACLFIVLFVFPRPPESP